MKETPLANIKPSEGKVFKVDSSISCVLLGSANINRLGFMIYNNSTKILYVRFGANASLTDFSLQIGAGEYYELPSPTYTGAITGIWDEENGTAQITEMT